MNPPLPKNERELIEGVFRRHPEITQVKIFGSRAKGTHHAASDVDLAVWGDVSSLAAESLAAELDELPLPYKFEVQPYELIRLRSLREHIDRVGQSIYEIG